MTDVQTNLDSRPNFTYTTESSVIPADNSSALSTQTVIISCFRFAVLFRIYHDAGARIAARLAVVKLLIEEDIYERIRVART